jgi:hypothetical protein
MKMAQIKFKAKVQDVYNMDDTLAYRYVQIPTLGRQHCDMSAFRQHKKYGGFANSDIFPAMLARIRKEIGGPNGTLKLDALPDGVSVDLSGFLALVTYDA